MTARKIPSTDEAWDDGSLGQDERYVAVADESAEVALNEALNLRAISIRLPKKLVQEYKLIAHHHGVGYQPLMRDVLERFVPGAMREILEELATQAQARVDNKAPLLGELRKKEVA